MLVPVPLADFENELDLSRMKSSPSGPRFACVLEQLIAIDEVGTVPNVSLICTR